MIYFLISLPSVQKFHIWSEDFLVCAKGILFHLYPDYITLSIFHHLFWSTYNLKSLFLIMLSSLALFYGPLTFIFLGPLASISLTADFWEGSLMLGVKSCSYYILFLSVLYLWTAHCIYSTWRFSTSGKRHWFPMTCSKCCICIVSFLVCQVFIWYVFLERMQVMVL